VAVAADVGVAVGCANAVCVMAAETVPATIVSMGPVSTVGAKTGAEAVGSPGTTQAVMTAKNIRATKIVRLLFMVFSSIYEIKKPHGYYSREASWSSQDLSRKCVFLHKV
jgi:hypothetical protein